MISAVLILTPCLSCSKTPERTLSGKTYTGPAWVVDQSKTYYAEIDTTEGMMKMMLFDDAAPFAVNSFIYLAAEEFFNNMYFFRTIDDFMIQTGDPNHLGTGDAGYRFQSELPPPYVYEPGIVAMANGGNNSSSVSGKTDFLLAGSKPGPEKIRKAEELGIKIIGEDEFMEMIPSGESPVVEDDIVEPTLF